MKNRKRKILWITGMLLAFLFVMPLCAYGAGTGIFLETWNAGGMELQVLCTRPDDADDELTKEMFSLTLAGEELPVTSLTSIGSEDFAVTVYCLVDVSGSMRSEQMQQAKEVLYAVCDGLGDKDNMVIATLGNQTQSSGFLSDTNAIKEVIDGLAAGNEDTNLYAGIVDSLGILRTDVNVNPKRCLLILSDGEDDQKTGITKEEAERSVTDTRIPVYTVATLPENPDTEKTNYGKLLGSFARMSVGGVHYVPAVDGMRAEEAGADIVSRIDDGLVLKAEMPALSDSQSGMQLRVVYTASDNSRYEDSIAVYAEDFLRTEEESETQTAIEEETVTEPAQTTVQEMEEAAEMETEIVGSDDEEDEEDTVWEKLMANIKEHLWIWIVGASAVVLLIGVLIVLFVVKCKKRKRQAESGKNEDSLPGYGNDSAGAAQNFDSLQPGMQNITQNAAQTTTQFARNRTRTLVLKAVGYEQIEHRIELPEGVEVTIGRNSKADIVLDPEDKKLSGIHCAMKLEDGKIFVYDKDSMNGTFVNGIPIKQMGRVVIHEGETIRMGSYEYRIG